MLPSCLTPCKYKYRERRSHFLALSKDNHAQSGVPSQIRGRPGVTGGQPVLCRIVAVGWPGPVAALVLFARSSEEKVTAYPPPSSPDYARGRRCLSAKRRMHIAKLNGRLCGAKRPHSVSEQPNFYQSLQSNPYNDSSHPSGGE